MADIYIVNFTTGGMYPSNESSFHLVESEAQAAFAERMESGDAFLGVVELIRLDTVTLEATTIRGWEGTRTTLKKKRRSNERS
jgi:hypothetical protein